MNLPLPPSAQHACLQGLASAVERVGWDTPFSQYSQPQVLGVIEAVLIAYEAALRKGEPSPAPATDAFFEDEIPF